MIGISEPLMNLCDLDFSIAQLVMVLSCIECREDSLDCLGMRAYLFLHQLIVVMFGALSFCRFDKVIVSNNSFKLKLEG